MNEDGRNGWMLWLLAVPAMLLCCGGPVIVAAIVSFGLGGWLVAHGAWILAAAFLIAGVAGTLWWLARRRQNVYCPPDTPTDSTADRLLGGRPRDHRSRDGAVPRHHDF